MYMYYNGLLCRGARQVLLYRGVTRLAHQNAHSEEFVVDGAIARFLDVTPRRANLSANLLHKFEARDG